MKFKNKIFLLLFGFVTAVQPCFAVTIPSELMFVAKKFAMAMLGIIIASVLIYLGLSIYGKFFHNPKKQEQTSYKDNELESAQSIDNAISNFLNRTKL